MLTAVSPRRARTPCTQAGCSELTDGGRCAEHARAADHARGTAADRGYTSPGHLRFRRRVLARDLICVVCRRAPATVADHHPRSRRQLLAAGEDPDDPAHGRGVCEPCHASETAKHQPGGWNAS